MRTCIPISVSCLLLLFACSSATATDYPPADHAGADLTLADGDVIWGEHTNIGTLTVATSATVHVAKHCRDTTGPEGDVTLVAQHVILNGTIDASDCGYAGGDWVGCSPFSCVCYTSKGEGPFAGGAPCGDTPYYPAQGGYMDCAANGDTTQDDTVTSGSGGEGKGVCFWGSYTGLWGGSGGGSIRIKATQTFTSGPYAGLLANATREEYEHDGSSYYQESGAGGGILLDARAATSVSIAPGFRAEAKSDGWKYPYAVNNGGTVKLFIPVDIPASSINVSASRVFRPVESTTVTLQVKQKCRSGNRCSLVAKVQYTNGSSSPLSGDDYDVWVIDDPSRALLYQYVPEYVNGSSWHQGTAGALKPGGTRRLKFTMRHVGLNTGKYLLWRLRHLEVYAVAGPIQ